MKLINEDSLRRLSIDKNDIINNIYMWRKLLESKSN